VLSSAADASFFHPQAVHFEDCQGISVKGITLQNSQSYHLTFTRSSDVEANYLRVTSPEHSVDTKGIHLVDSYNVHVMDNLISTGICNLPTLHSPASYRFSRRGWFSENNLATMYACARKKNVWFTEVG
jgi:polygalacturonase